MPAEPPSQPILVKRYARSRLYDTVGRRYVPFEQLRGWAAEAVDFCVVDADTGSDVTRTLLG